MIFFCNQNLKQKSNLHKIIIINTFGENRV
jgi:hypothetical protein